MGFNPVYIAAKGGLVGCDIASRLKHRKPSITITNKHSHITLVGGFALRGSELDWHYHTEPDNEIQGLLHTLVAAKTLGHGLVLNYGGWRRGYRNWLSHLVGVYYPLNRDQIEQETACTKLL